MPDPYMCSIIEVGDGSGQQQGFIAEALNLASQESQGGKRFEITAVGGPATVGLMKVGYAYYLTIHQGAVVRQPTVEVVLDSLTLQHTKTGPGNVIMILREGDPAPYGLVRRSSSFAEVPKFTSQAEADAWMDEHAESARGALDRVLRPKGP